MIEISKIFTEKHPTLVKIPIIGPLIIRILKRMFHENIVNEFMVQNKQWRGMEFCTKVLQRLNYTYFVNNHERANIPETGRLVVIANHPIGTLDGVALVKLISEIRPDVKVVVNSFLYEFFEPLRQIFIPLDNMSKNAFSKTPVVKIIRALENEEVVVIFPAGEVSRIRPTGIKDGEWLNGFLFFVEKTKSPILPIHVAGRNSAVFYSISSIYKTLGTYLLLHEMMKQNYKSLRFRIGEIIPYSSLEQHKHRNRQQLSLMLRTHLYQLPKKKRTHQLFKTEKTISHAADKGDLITELRQSDLLSSTADGHEIYLVEYRSDSAILREIGRIRELAFRLVGEGSGKNLDLDEFDEYYLHLVLWNPDDLEIAGAYRMGHGATILKSHGFKGFYTSTLVDFSDDARAYLEQGVEMGRSFVNPRYWGNRSLDLLWYGIGAYMVRHPEIKYMFGPVSLSNNYPEEAKAAIVAFYHLYHGPQGKSYATPKHPYQIPESALEFAKTLGDNPASAYRALNAHLKKTWQVRVPTMYKQYSDLTHQGTEFISFGLDPNFNNCIDGMIMVDLDKMTRRSMKRIPFPHVAPDENGLLKWREHTLESNKDSTE